MATKSRVSFVFLLLSILLLFAGFAFASKLELKQCKHQCKVQQQFDEGQKEACMERCEDYHREKKEREGEDPHDFSMEDSGKKLRQCMAQCERTAEEVRQICHRQCEQKWGREAEKGGDGNTKEKKEKKEEEEDSNPYVFENEHFDVEMKSEGGSIFLLPKFTDRSNLLRGVENYRLGVLVVYPNAFVAPNHLDADALLVVTQGKGTVSLILENKRESFNVECGDLFRIPPGTPVYLINRDENEKLYVVKLIQTINVPGQYEVFFSRGGKKGISIFTALSWNILEAALKTSRDQLERLFMRQDKGPIFGASREQIKALSHHEKGGSAGGSIWPFGGESRDALNIFNQRPSMSNNYGELFEADKVDFKPLGLLDIRVSYVNLTKGSMSGPYFHSKSTNLCIVVKGRGGYFEMACPHVSKQDSKDKEWQSSARYQKINAPLETDTVFIVPPAHLFVTVASKNSNMEILCFEVNAEGNIRYPLAGKRNIVKLFENEAKELVFKSKVEEVDQVFNNQDEEMFFPGPRQEGGHSYI
ncbi:hypothetical protein SLA2020_107390 [Shorea laevis]